MADRRRVFLLHFNEYGWCTAAVRSPERSASRLFPFEGGTFNVRFAFSNGGFSHENFMDGFNKVNSMYVVRWNFFKFDIKNV